MISAKLIKGYNCKLLYFSLYIDIRSCKLADNIVELKLKVFIKFNVNRLFRSKWSLFRKIIKQKPISKLLKILGFSKHFSYTVSDKILIRSY